MNTAPIQSAPENSAPILAAPEKPNLMLAFFAGLAAALIGAVAWAAVTVTTEYQIGWMAIGVGFLVGFAVSLGKGSEQIFGILGAILALLGCVLGNFFAIIGFATKQEHLGLLTTLTSIDYSKVPSIMTDAFSSMDLLFYGIAVYEGYRFSMIRRRKSSPEI